MTRENLELKLADKSELNIDHKNAVREALHYDDEALDLIREAGLRACNCGFFDQTRRLEKLVELATDWGKQITSRILRVARKIFACILLPEWITGDKYDQCPCGFKKRSPLADTVAIGKAIAGSGAH